MDDIYNIRNLCQCYVNKNEFIFVVIYILYNAISKMSIFIVDIICICTHVK